MGITTGKIAEVMFENAIETHEEQNQMVTLTDFHEPDAGTMQNSGNVIWSPVQQHRPVIEGWDLSGEETGLIEETYPAVLGTPNNDLLQLRADDMRDRRFWERAGKESGRTQVSTLNKDIATAVAQQGSLFYRTNVTSGYDFIATAQATMNERQGKDNGRCFVLNDRATLKFSKDLASRETIKGRPAKTWDSGQIGSNVAQFDVYTGSYLPNLTGGADPATTVTGDQSFAPEAGTVNPTTKVVTNVDYRTATLVVAASGSYNVGDKVNIANTAVNIQSIGLQDKTATGQAMTFTVVSKPDATHIEIFPKPIALDDPALTKLEAAYANINTRILNGATVNRLNTAASEKTNLFWDKDAIEVIGGTIPAELFKEFDGMKVLTQTMSNGLTMYMVYDGNMITMNFRYRLFVWYGITIANPSNCGVALSY